MQVRLSLLLFLSLSASAAEIRPYASHGKLKLTPDGSIQVEAGDVLVFTNGRRFPVEAVLGGKTNRVVDIGEGKILRMPIRSEPYYEKFVPDYFDGYRALIQAGVRVPTIDMKKSDRLEYVVQEKVEIRCLLQDVNLLPDEERERAFEELVKFASNTAGFAYIGDFNSGQLAWTGQHWVLLDWVNAHIHFPNLAQEHTFSLNMSPNPIPKYIYLRLEEAIHLRRSTFDCATPLSGFSL